MSARRLQQCEAVGGGRDTCCYRFGRGRVARCDGRRHARVVGAACGLARGQEPPRLGALHHRFQTAYGSAPSLAALLPSCSSRWSPAAGPGRAGRRAQAARRRCGRCHVRSHVSSRRGGWWPAVPHGGEAILVALRAAARGTLPPRRPPAWVSARCPRGCPGRTPVPVTWLGLLGVAWRRRGADRSAQPVMRRGPRWATPWTSRPSRTPRTVNPGTRAVAPS